MTVRTIALASALSTAALLTAGCGEFQQSPVATAQAAPAPAAGDAAAHAADRGEDPAVPHAVAPSPKGTTVNENEEKVTKTEEEWQEILSPEEYYVLRQKGTEPPRTGKYDKHFEPGTYVCAGCGAELFESDTKFSSHCGWPSFYAAKAGDKVELHDDFSHFMVRTEVTCARCGGHLGHVFDDAPDQPTGQRYCINSVSLKFIPRETSAEKEPESASAGDEPASESR